MPKSLRRSTTNCLIAGVIGGLAEFFELDATLLRVVYVILSIASVAFPGILVYLILWFLIPKADQG
jgi:phage shock protein C